MPLFISKFACCSRNGTHVAPTGYSVSLHKPGRSFSTHPPTDCEQSFSLDAPLSQGAPLRNGPTKLARFAAPIRWMVASYDLRRLVASSLYQRVAKTVSYLRLAAGSGTTLVDQVRPASRLAMPMFAVPFMRSEDGTSFGIEPLRNIVRSSRSLEQTHRLRCPPHASREQDDHPPCHFYWGQTQPVFFRQLL